MFILIFVFIIISVIMIILVPCHNLQHPNNAF